MSEKLKNCPFCGGEAYHMPYKGSGHKITCDALNGCTVYAYTPEKSSKEEAIKAWNTRAENTTLIEKLEWMKKKKCVGYCPSEHIQSAKIQAYNQALQDAIDLIEENE